MGENRKGAMEMKRVEVQQEGTEGQKEEEEGSPPWLASSQTLCILAVPITIALIIVLPSCGGI